MQLEIINKSDIYAKKLSSHGQAKLKDAIIISSFSFLSRKAMYFTKF